MKSGANLFNDSASFRSTGLAFLRSTAFSPAVFHQQKQYSTKAELTEGGSFRHKKMRPVTIIWLTQKAVNAGNDRSQSEIEKWLQTVDFR